MVAALIFTLWAYRSRLTYNNFMYLLRDIDEAGHSSLASEAVYYTANDTNVYLYFRGDLAVGSSNGIAFHRALGSRSFEDALRFKAPMLCGSDKYMIAYDFGGKSFYVYNSISRVYSEMLNHAIIDCAAADNGDFAILTKSDVGDSVIRMYDNDFNLVGEVTREGYVYAIEFLSDSRLYICECYESDAALYTDFSVYTLGSESIDTSVSVSGLVLDASKIKDVYAIISDTCVSFYGEDGKQKSLQSFGTSDIKFGDVSKDAACVLLDKNEIGSDCVLSVLFADKNGYNIDVSGGAKGAVLCGEKACVLYDGYLLVGSSDGEKKIEIPRGGKKLLAKDKNSVIVCFNDYAKVFEVK